MQFSRRPPGHPRFHHSLVRGPWPYHACIGSLSLDIGDAREKLRIRQYTVVSRAVEDGVAMGWRHATKHQDLDETLQDTLHDLVVDHIPRDVMLALEEVIDFDV